jgi:hypothetical protein
MLTTKDIESKPPEVRTGRLDRGRLAQRPKPRSISYASIGNTRRTEMRVPQEVHDRLERIARLKGWSANLTRLKALMRGLEAIEAGEDV